MEGKFRAGRGQVSLEYLTTYGWALLILVIVLGALFMVGINPNTTPPSTCLFSGDLNCRAYGINTTGHFVLDVGQGTGHTIRVTYLRCTQDVNATLNSSDLLPSPVTIPNSQHAFVSNNTNQCYRTQSDGSLAVAAGSPGNVYRGKIYVRYTDIETNYQHTAIADVVLKYENTTMNTPVP